MGPRALTASSVFSPVEHGGGSYLGQRKSKDPTAHGVKGAYPLMLPPPRGERGGHTRNFHAGLKKNRGDFYRARNSTLLKPVRPPFDSDDDQ